ncbi:TraR/DksA family transcriptional regulator [Chondromyces apiculatus]|uniref:C4-type zinc finger protein, DksA/TraR family n=1 Tax=Chondromyces apiculatus DSM 436 TaxID=1192034 RepID=A0A017SZY0_9BACT|nr:TraR/DksA C4-type zinc finger protein [Chondromyces apiculatus]EYF02150.1 C4-type zinc finger protein, DksA/TraR family [Chondromyces apiculatus DSM 436]
MSFEENSGPKRNVEPGGAAAAPAAIRPPTRVSAARDDDDGPQELTAEQLDELRRMLQDRRSAIVGSIGERQNEERDVSTSRVVGDEMDEATLEGTTSMTGKLLERDVRLLSEIDRALAKLRENAYGMCEGTSEPIGYARLRLQPWARYSVEYQEELEREERTRGGR